MILFFDTETTGLVKNWNNRCDPANPKLVQLGMVACEGTRSIFTYGSIVKPYYPPETLTEGAFAAHGISYEMAEKFGSPLQEILDKFTKWSSCADQIVAHNIKFDECVIMNAFGVNDELPNKFCTMLESTPVCKMFGPKGYKWPKLSEAYRILFDEDLVNAHDAMTDVLACKRVYFHLIAECAKT